MADFKEFIENEPEEQEEENKDKAETLQSGTTKLDTKDIEKVDEKVFEFDDRKVKRYFYTFKSGKKLIIPQSVHKQMSTIARETDITQFKIKKEGAGINTKYTVTPTKEK